MEPQPFGHGNHLLWEMEKESMREPSMEPQPFGHGNLARYPQVYDVHVPSMEPQPFGHGNAQSNRRPAGQIPSFNGATAFRPWKPWHPEVAVLMAEILQWSHSLSAMETSIYKAGIYTVDDLQWSHSLSAMETCLSPAPATMPTLSFNGATAFRPWKRRNQGNHPDARLPPFNGATAFRPWKLTKPMVNIHVSIVLQWSHSLSAMET